MLRVLLAFSLTFFALAGVGALTGSFRDGFLHPLARRTHGGRGGLRWADHALGLALACAFIAVVLATASTLGFMRDEGMYFDASKSYAAWFEKVFAPDPLVRAAALDRASVDAHWAPNSEHPSLMKSGFALSWIFLWKTWPQGLIELFHRHTVTTPLAWVVAGLARIAPKLFLEESASLRFPGMVTGGLILWLLYLFGSETIGRAGGIVAALLYAGLPRPFFDAHLAGFDAAAVLAWLAVAYTYWKGLDAIGWAVASGFVWGLALLTKHNSWFLPFVFLVHYGWLAWEVLRPRPGAHPTFRGRIRRLPIPWPFLFMGMIGPALFVYGWPRLWYDTWSRIDWYFTFHARHDYYNIEYLHRTYFRPPFPISMPYALIAATVPAATLVAAVFGLAAGWRAVLAPVLSAPLSPLDAVTGAPRGDDARRTTFFWFLNFNLPIALIAHPKIPHFGGTKHWHPAYPFLCLFAAAGVLYVAKRLPVSISRGVPARRWWVVAAVAAMGGLVVLPGIIETRRSHPHGLTHYTPLVGGPPGGADRGLNRGFWGYETGAIVEWLNVHFPKGGRVYPNDTFYSSWEQLHLDGRLRANIEAEWSNPLTCDVAVVEHEQHMDEVEHQIWMVFGTVTPAYVVALDGTPALTVYVHPKSSRYVP